jgi:hypothetical protein
MKKLISIILLISSAHALEVSFLGPCSDTPLHISNESLELEKSVGHYTVEVLEKHNIDYIGSERGLNSAFGTPTGEGALEILSNSEMRAYGWCYRVGGFEPGVFPHEYFVGSDEDHIVWFFGFAHYKEGQWITQCEPAHELKPAFLCR